MDSYKYITLALTADGEVYVWGNGYGTTPVKLKFSRKIIDIAGNIVLAENRRAYNLAETMSYGKDLIKISAGENHYLGLTSDGEVFAWGTNNYGQLGNGNNTSSNIPTKVVTPDGTANISNIVEISAGDNYSIISNKDGNVYTFGHNSYNRLGQGTTRNVPEKIEGLSKIELVSASEGSHTAVADWDGYVYTVGLNDCGQLGLKDKTNRANFEMVGELQIECDPNPIVINVGDTQDISLSLGSSFNLKSDSHNNKSVDKEILNESIASISGNTITGKAIGKTILSATYEGTIGTVNTDIKSFNRNIEILVLPEDGKVVPQVESGNGFTVSLKADGTVWSWGQNQYGQLGLGNTNSYNEPQKISIIKNTITNADGSKTEVEEVIKDIAVGNYQTLALSETGKVYSWGLGSSGQLGIGNRNNKYTPVVVTDIYGNPLEDIVKVEAGENVSFAIDSKGDLYAWGYGYVEKAQKLDVIDNIVDVTSKYVLSGDGNVYNILTKERLPLVGQIVELDEGKDHTVMLTSEGKGYSIGDNTYGQLGNGNNVSSFDTPVAIRDLSDNIFTNIKEIKAGDKYTVIVTNDGKVYTVGINDNNELGIDNTEILDRSLPEINENIENVIFATAGDNHVTVIKNDGTVYAWGNGKLGELGNRKNKDSITPVMVGDYIVRTNANRIVLGVNSEKIIEGYVDYFNVFNNNAININYSSKDSSVASLANTQIGNTQVTSTLNSDNKFEIKLIGKKFGTTIVTAEQENSTNIGVIQVEVIPDGNEIEPMVETSGSHTITLRVDGKVFTYGDNTYGQLGNGTTKSSDEPVEVKFEEGTKIVQISAGEYHNVALDSNGNVWTWGRNNNYQIGHSGGNQYTPYKVNGLPKAIKIAAGNNNTMIITENKELYGWGLNAYGDLGLGNYTNRVLPKKVTGIKDIIDISGGKSHFIVLNSNGEVYTTGSNLYGQLGLGRTDINKVNEFTKVEISEKIGTINAGELSNIVTTVDGYVYSWGGNTYGQLGTNDNINKNKPTRIENVQDIRQVNMGKTHSIIRDGSNKVYLAGTNTYGQLGNASNANTTIFEENVRISDVLRVSAGNTYTTFLKKDGFVWACGDYNHGDKTKKSKTNSKVPVLVGSDSSSLESLEIVLMKSDIKSIMANAKFKFNLIYIDENNTSNFSYSSYNTDIAKVNENGDILGLREGTTWVKAVDGKTGKEHIAIVRVIDNTKDYNSHVAPKVLAGANFAIGLKEDGTVWTWGYDTSRLAETNIPSNINVLSSYKDISAGKNHALAIRENGTVWSVGNNEYGELGIGTTDNKPKLVQVEGLTDIVQIAAGENHSIAMDSFGIVYGFGANSNGQLGSDYIGANTTSPVVVKVPNERILQISAGKEQSAFVTANGTVYGMGKILNGYIPNISDAVKAEVGDGYILILRTDGSIYRYQYGVLTKVSNVSNAIDISVQNKVNMYQSVDEKVYTWGTNTFGQLGTGSNTSTSLPTEPIENSTNVFRIGSGYNNTYIISNTGFVYASGTNTFGELGNGTNENEESTTKELSLTHTLVGDRNFTIKPESNTLEVNEVENLSVESNTFNVFRKDKKDLNEYEWKSEDPSILAILGDGIVQGINLGKTKVIAKDKVTGEEKEGIRVIVPVDTDRIESITASGKEADVTDAYQYEVKIPVDEDTTKSNVTIKTKLETDDISIDNGTTWSKGVLSTVVDIKDELTIIPFIVKTEAGNELNYTLTIIKVSNNNNLANITIKTEEGSNEVSATKVSDDVYEAIVPQTGINKVKVTSENDKAYVSIRGLTKQLKEQTYNLVMTKEVEELPIKIISESGREKNYTLFVYREDYAATLKNVVVNGVNATKVSDTEYEITINKNVNESEVTALTNVSTATVGINNSTKEVNKITKKVQTTGDKTIITIQVEEPTTGLTKEYTLTINKKQTGEEDPNDPDNPEINDEVAIEKISVNELIGNPDIEANVSETANDVYEVYLQNPVKKVNVIAKTKDSSSQIKISDNDYAISQDIKEIELDSTLTEVLINVRSDFGTEKEYTLRIYTISDDTSLEEITVGDVKATYNNSTGRYEVRVDKNLTMYDITAKAKETSASLTIENTIPEGTVEEKGTINVTVSKTGENTQVSIKVLAPNGISEEIHNLVIMEKSDIADIEIVRVNGQEIIKSEDGNYIANITSNTKTVKIFAKTVDDYANITIDDETNNTNNITITREISQDVTIYDIEVLAEDGVTTVNKKLTINRLSDNTNVKEITVEAPVGSSYTVTQKEDGTYYCKVPREDFASVKVTLEDENASVTIAGGQTNKHTSTESVELLNEITEVNAVIESESGTQRTIIIKIEKQSNDASLLQITSKLAKKVTKLGGDKYEIQVDDRLETLVIDAITTNENAQIKLGTESLYTKNKIENKEINLNEVSSFTIDVLAEDGVTAKTYTIEVTKKFSTDIKSIITDLEEATRNEYVYNGWVDNDDIANIVITADNPLAKISVYKNVDLIGEDTEEVTLKDDMQTEKQTYRIVVTGPNSESSEYILYVTKKSTNNNIEYIKVNGVTLIENSESGKYEVEVGTVENDEYVLEVKAEDKYASISLDNEEYSKTNKVTKTYKINPGETKEISVRVKSQNGEEVTKTVSIYRKDNNVQIESVKINDNIITNCDEAHKNYTVILDNTVDLADLEIVLASSKTTIKTSIDEIDYNEVGTLLVEDITLPGVGKKVIEFTLTAEDGTTDTKTITIIQFSSNIELEQVKVNEKDAIKRADGNYEITIGDIPNVASIFAKAQESDSTVIINNVGSGSLGQNTENIRNIIAGQTIDVPIKVISADGTEYEYTLYIKVKSANNNIEYVKVNNLDAEKVDDTTYRIFVNQSLSQATVDIKASNEMAKITTNVSGVDKTENPLNFVETLINEKTNVKFVVTSEAEGQKEYTLEIIKESNDNTIKNVYVNGIEVQKDNETGRYKVAIEDAENALVKVITNNEYAYVRIGVSQEGQGQKEERVELKDTKITTIPITIRSQTGVTKVEYLDIEKIYTESRIDTLIVDDKEVTDYNSSSKTYTALVDSKASEHEIFIMSANTYATLEINDDVDIGNITTYVKIPEEDLVKELTLKVTTESGETENYTVRLIKKSTNVNVSEVIVNDVTLSPKEDCKDIYEKSIKKLADKAKIKIVTEYPYAHIKIADCDEKIGVSEEWVNLSLDEDVITVPVLITASDGETIATYNIILNRLSNDTEITVAYDEMMLQRDDEGKYQVEILDTKESGKIKVTANDINTKIDIANTNNYEQGMKEYTLQIDTKKAGRIIEIPISVISQDGTVEESVIVITRISTNTNVSKVEGTFKVDNVDKTKQATVDDDGLYVIPVTDTVNEIKLNVVLESEYATIMRGTESGKGKITTDVELKDKETYVTYSILAEDGETTNTITVKIVKQSSETGIAKLTVDGKQILPDEKGVYNASVLGGTADVKTIVTAVSDKATIKIGETSKKAVLDTNLGLDNIENTFKIKVIAEDGSQKEYILKITKQTNIVGKIITENTAGKHKSLITVYKTNDTRVEDDEINPREIIKQIETNEDGTFVIDVKDIEKYDLVVTKPGYLDYRVTGIEVVKGEKTTLEDYKLIAGDVVKTGEIEIDDLVAINDKYGTRIVNQDGVIDKNAIYDLNEDGIVDRLDRNILKANYSKVSETVEWVNPNAPAVSSFMLQKEEEVKTSNATETKVKASNDVIKTTTKDTTKLIEKTEEVISESSKVTNEEINEKNTEVKDFILPMSCSYTITSPYGTRTHPITGATKKHTGIDISGTHHTNIFAVADGEVTFAGVQSGYGNCIEIKHVVNGETIYSFYAHLSKIDVKKGDKVTQGQKIALEGGDPKSDPNPGSSTGHHLHFEIRNASKKDVNPNNYIKF